MNHVEYVHPLRETLQWAIGKAVQAPSVYNTQPWRFRIRGSSIELRADRSRALHVVDPEGRELTLSCGAALFHLRVALRARSLDIDVRRLPDPSEADLIARIAVAPGRSPTEDERSLCEAIPHRHTCRTPYMGITVPDEVIERLRRDVESEGAWLTPLSEETQRVRLVALIMEADHQQWSDPHARQEYSRWIRSNDSSARDGVFGYSFGLENVESHLAAVAVRLMDRGTKEAILHRDMVDASPLLVVIGTDGDSPLHWVNAGEALDRALLRAESEDIRVAFLNQAVEDPELRPLVGEITGRSGSPHVILRLGYGTPSRGTPRRDVSDVLERSP